MCTEGLFSTWTNNPDINLIENPASCGVLFLGAIEPSGCCLKFGVCKQPLAYTRTLPREPENAVVPLKKLNLPYCMAKVSPPNSVVWVSE